MKEQTQTNVEPRTLQGVVVSDASDKTAVVEVRRYVKHPRYGKYIEKRKKFKAHDAENRVKVGDQVTIAESRPISKDKHFVVVYND